MSAFFDVPTGQQPAGVLLLDPETGLPVTPAATGLTNAQLVAALAAALIKTEPLGRLGIAHEITAAATASTPLVLQPGTVRLRLSARGANCRVAIGVGAQTASVTTATVTTETGLAAMARLGLSAITPPDTP